MKKADNASSQLLRELAFIQGGGYRDEGSWRPPQFFEDSPICTGQDGTCNRNCALLGFVPTEYRNEAVPCRYIPLNRAGETLESMYRTGTNEEIEDVIRNWLLSTIGEFDRASAQTKSADEAA